MTVTATPFWDQVALNAIGPLVTALVGLLLGGLAINVFTRALQDRRAAIELKQELISEITETASSLYHHIVQYTRAQTDAVGPASDKAATEEERRRLRQKLIDQFPATRAQAEVLQARLTAYFEEPRVAVAWHAVRDCLTVRYYYEISRAGAEQWGQISRENSRGWQERYHTGLLFDDLGKPDRVNKAYKCHLKTTANLIFACPLRPRRIRRRAIRSIDRALEQARKEDFDYNEPVEGSAPPTAQRVSPHGNVVQP